MAEVPNGKAEGIPDAYQPHLNDAYSHDSPHEYPLYARDGPDNFSIYSSCQEVVQLHSCSPTMDSEKTRDNCTTWVSNFQKPFSDTFTEADFLSSYHPQVEWYDHAFHVRRVSHEAVLGLRKSFLHCNQSFHSEIKAIHPIPPGAVVEQLWSGCCKHDIVRPDGEVAVTASGKNFENHVCFVLEIDSQGLITKIQEFYNKKWDDGINMASYSVIGSKP